MIILNYIFNGNIFKSAIKILAIAIIISIIEAILLLLGMLLMNLPFRILLEDDFYTLILSIVSKILELLIIYLLYRLNINISWLNDSNTQQSRYRHILIIITSVLLFMFGTTSYISNNSQNFFIFNIFSFIIYVILIISVLLAFREGSKLEIIQYANELKKENIQQLIEFNEMVAKERHEYKNHLNTIFGLCTLNKQDLSDKIKQYINNYANNSLTQNLSIASGNDFVDAIINVKYNNALRKGIEVLVNFEEPLSSAKISEDVAVTIISNIIENAFESMLNYEREKKFVRIETYIREDTYYISISNNGPMIQEADKKKIFNAGFSTKDNPSKTRGFGLSIVLHEINRCCGNITINSSDEVTEFLISLKVDPQDA